MAIVPKAPPSAFAFPGVNSEARLSVSVTVEWGGGNGMRCLAVMTRRVS